MPAHDMSGWTMKECAAPVPPHLGEENPERPVARAQLWTLDGALQGRELLAKRHALKGDAW